MAWREVAVQANRFTRGQEEVTDDIARLASSTEAAPADIGLALREVHTVAALSDQKRMHANVAAVDGIGAHDLVSHVTKRGARLSTSRVNEALAAMLIRFPVIGEDPATPPQIIDPAAVLPRKPAPTIATLDD